MSDELLHKALVKHKPAKINLYRGDELYRTVVPTAKKKRWEAVELLIDKLQWDRLEMLNAAGSLLDAIEVEAEEPEATPDAPAAGDGRDERMLNLLMRATREIRQDHNAESKESMKAMVEVVREITSAVRGLVEVHNLQIQSLKTALRIPVQAAPQKDEWSEALDLLKTIQPLLLKESGGGTNGVKKENAQ